MIIKPEHPKRIRTKKELWQLPPDPRQKHNELIRLNENKRLDPNDETRPGQDKKHNRFCWIENYGIRCGKKGAYRSIWCATHGEWAHEYPVKTVCIHTFANGEVVETRSEPQRLKNDKR